MDSRQTIKINLERVEKLINDGMVILENGISLPSWIELSLIDYCNRKCSFCPKGNDSIAPNLKLEMPKKLYKKIARELKDLNFKGTVILAGYGEPMAAKNLIDAIKSFSVVCNVEIVTNGDFLTVKSLDKMKKAGIGKIIVSMYDGRLQIAKFVDLFSKADIPPDRYILRDRWYGEEKDFGVKLTNRAGVVKIGRQKKVKLNARCFYPHYSMMVDWNGDVFLCTQDWYRRIKSGNLAFFSLYSLWTSSILKKYRTHLYKGKRDLFPCNQCNARGVLHGARYAEIWQNFYEKQTDSEVNR